MNYGIILGCPRSGTTYLVNCLRALDNAEVHSGDRLPVTIPQIVNQPINEQIYHALSFGFKLTLDNFIDSTKNSRLIGINRFFRREVSIGELMQYLRQIRQFDSLIFKEPFLSFAPEFTYHALPDCKIVHIFRDGRDVANSLVRTYGLFADERLYTLNNAEMPLGRKVLDRFVPWWLEEGGEQEFLDASPYVRSIWMWKTIVRLCHEFFSRPEIQSSGRVLLLKYEDLVKDPVGYGSKVIQHFAGTMNPRLEKRFKQAKTSSIGTYKRRELIEVEAATKIAQSELKLYGYDI